MNTPNNKRRRQSKIKISKVFIDLMQTKEIQDISVTQICKLAKVNRTTFYACYQDIYDLADNILHGLIKQVNDVYCDELTQHYNSNDWLKILRHIYDNQIFYKTCFKLGIEKLPIERYDFHFAEKLYENKYIEYHMEFFRAGFNQIVKMWLNGGCKETPEEIEYIIKTEYKNKDI